MEPDYLKDLPEEAIVKIESKLFKTFSQLAAIVDSSTDAIVGFNVEGIITSWNKAGETIYGYAKKDIMGKNMDILWPDQDKDEPHRLIKNVVSGQAIKDFEVLHLAEGNKKIFVSLTLSPIKDDVGNITGVSMIARDITERKEMEATLKQFDEVTRLNKIMIDREVKMVELKEEIKKLKERLGEKID